MGESNIVILNKHAEDRYAELVLNRPEKRNAVNPELFEGFMRALDEVEEDPGIAVLVTRGAGKAFSSGMDLNYLKTQPSVRRRWSRPSLTIQMIQRLRVFTKVSLAAIDGYALGGGMALVMAHDLAIASRSARIGMPEIIRGSFGQAATSSLFHAGIPLKKAFWVQLTGESLDGEEAERWGLVSRCVPDAEFEEAVRRYATLIAGHAPAALEHGKIAAYLGREMAYPEALRLDELVGSRMALRVDPFADVEGYLRSQHGGGDPRYLRPDGHGGGESGDQA